MSERRADALVSLTREQVEITVYAFGGTFITAGWIEDGQLATIAGGAARSVRVEVGPQTEIDADCSLMRRAVQILRQRGYRDLWRVAESGQLERVIAI